MYITKGSD